jgi:uncharacterized protein (TIGR00369 family)
MLESRPGGIDPADEYSIRRRRTPERDTAPKGRQGNSFWGAVARMLGKQSKRGRALTTATRRHLKESRAIAMFGFELDAVSPGRAVLRLDARPRHKQLNNVVHGGILAALADTAAAIAAYTTVPKGVALATIELKINYLEAVPGGRIRAEAQVLRTGRNFVVTECEIFGSNGTLAAKALLTFGAAGGHSLQN